MSISQLEIDDNWTPKYGDWTFSAAKFPNAADVIKDLKTKVPAISVWVHPFVDLQANAFKFTSDQEMLMKIDEVSINKTS